MAEAVMVRPVDNAGRPTALLPLRMLLQISIYWMGLSSIFGGLDALFLPEWLKGIAEPGRIATTTALISTIGALVAVVVQPTIGSISDYTMSRWGRRKPYLVIGATLDVVFIFALANSYTVPAIIVFYMLLQFSSNFAQGPFQGYVPDLVPAPQVGLASALVGVMSVVGNVVGLGTVALALVFTPPGEKPDFQWPLLALGLFELTTAIVTVVTVDEGRKPRDRAGRPWLSVAVEAWGREVLRYPSYLWMIGSRLLILAGIGMILKVADWYMERSLGLDAGARGMWVFIIGGLIIAGVLISTFPAARLSDRVGRKPPIYIACLIGAAGMTIMGIAPHIFVSAAGALIVGIAGGMFLAVDWALMTDIIPKAAAGKFMGFSNLATGLAGVVALASGGTLVDLIDGAAGGPVGPRAAYGLAVAVFAAGALLLRQVDPTRLED